MDISIFLKVAGATLTTLGSALLAWRAYAISKFVKGILDAHEISLHALLEMFENGRNRTPFLANMGKHHDDYEKSMGFKLVIAGFAGLGLGAVCNALSYFI